ncbi:MAG: transglutaminase domain-containing protein [Abitibacteriaceae bacterium]|nr:transglutaminase domain-containing protein [Abditibacteriaceae bacterium]
MRRRWKRSWLAMALLVPVAMLAQEAKAAQGPYTLTAQFSYRATVADVPAGTKELRVWLPVPSNSEWQKVEDLKVTQDVQDNIASPYKVTQERKYGNRMVYLDIKHPPSTVAATVQFTVQRKNMQVLGAPTAPVQVKMDMAQAIKLLAPDAKVPIGGRYGGIAQQVTLGKTSREDKMRAIFDHVVATMQYDYKKESPEYGEGDVAFVCDYKKGNCSDLHSYMISLARSVGVPTILEYGFPIGGIPLADPLPATGKIGGYHCWVWFQNAQGNWVPVDASDARKWLDAGQPEKKDYLFGNLIPERSSVAFSRGRDITLAPAQKGGPLNYFIYPYAEADGKTVKADWVLTYQLPDKPALATHIQ